MKLKKLKFFLIFFILFCMIVPTKALNISISSPNGVCKFVNGEYYIVKGSKIDISLSGSPNEKIAVDIMYTFHLTASNGKYDFKQNSFPIPVTANFKVKAYPVNDLNVKAIIFLFISKTLHAVANSNGVAVVGINGVPSGDYDIEMYGSTNSSTVTVNAIASSTITLNSNGDYHIEYDSSKLPLGDMTVDAGGKTIIVHVVESTNQIPVVSSTPTLTPTVTPTPTPTPTHIPINMPPAPPITAPSQAEYSTSVSVMEDTPVTIEIPSYYMELTDISKVTAKVGFSGTLYIAVSKVSQLPSDVKSPNYPTYAYIEIVLYISSDKKVSGSGSVVFRVSKNWLSSHGYSPDQVVLLRYDNGWKELSTKKVGEDSGYYYYKANTHFCLFAIAVKPKAIAHVTPTPTTTVTPIPTAKPKQTPTKENTSRSVTSKNKTIRKMNNNTHLKRENTTKENITKIIKKVNHVKIPGYEFIIALACLVITVIFRRRR